MTQRHETARVENVLTAPAEVGEIRVNSASLGLSLSSTVAYLPISKGARRLQFILRNFGGGALVAQILLNPYLTILKTKDDGVTFTDYSEDAQDGSTSTDVTLSSLNTLANGDFIYVGSPVPFSGVNIDVDAANGNASVLTVKYLKEDGSEDGAWTSISATDGTDSGGATMAVDGSVTWTVPAAGTWRTSSIQGRKLYWTRWEVSAALDSSTTQNAWLSINRSTAYAELITGLPPFEVGVVRGTYGVGTIQAKTDQGTANLIVNAMSGAGRLFPS